MFAMTQEDWSGVPEDVAAVRASIEAEIAGSTLLAVYAETVAQARNASKDVPPSPIAELLLKQPWLIPKLYTGRIPA